VTLGSRVSGISVASRRDDVTRRLIHAIAGPLTVDAVVTRIERQAVEGTWTYASLIDMRAVTAWLSADDVVRVTDRARVIARELGPRGPVAIVVSHPALIPVGQAYAVMPHDAGAVGFFRDPACATRWLECQQAHGPVAPRD